MSDQEKIAAKDELLEEIHHWITKSAPYKAPEVIGSELMYFAQKIEEVQKQ